MIALLIVSFPLGMAWLVHRHPELKFNSTGR